MIPYRILAHCRRILRGWRIMRRTVSVLVWTEETKTLLTTMKPSTLLLISALGLFAGPVDAQDREVPVKITHLPERNWTAYKRVAIAEFTGDDGATVTPRSQDISDYVAQTFTKAGEVEVYDRNQLKKILKEQKTQMDGAFDEGSTIKAGKLIGADFMILGRVQQDDFAQDDNGMFIPSRSGGSVIPTTKGVYVLAVAFTILDPQTGRTLDNFVESVTIKSKSKIGNSAYMGVNDSEIKREALEAFSVKFSRNLAPYTEDATLKFLGDPAYKDELSSAIANFHMDETEQAIGQMKAIAERTDLKSRAPAKAKYNYGLILFAQNRCQEAGQLFKAAYLAEPKTTLYREAYDKAKEMCAGQTKPE